MSDQQDTPQPWEWRGFYAVERRQVDGFAIVVRLGDRDVLIATPYGGRRKNGQLVIERPGAPDLEEPTTIRVAWCGQNRTVGRPFNPFDGLSDLQLWQALVFPYLPRPRGAAE